MLIPEGAFDSWGLEEVREIETLVPTLKETLEGHKPCLKLQQTLLQPWFLKQRPRSPQLYFSNSDWILLVKCLIHPNYWLELPTFRAISISSFGAFMSAGKETLLSTLFQWPKPGKHSGTSFATSVCWETKRSDLLRVETLGPHALLVER